MRKLTLAALAAFLGMGTAAMGQETPTPTHTQTPNLCQVGPCDATPGTPCLTPVAASINPLAAEKLTTKQIHLKPAGTPGAVKMQWGCRQAAAGDIVWYQPTPGTSALVEQTTLGCREVYCRVECSSGTCSMDGYGIGFGVD